MGRSNEGKSVISGGGLVKDRILCPYKRIKTGTEFNVVVDGIDTVAIVDRAGKYTYLNVNGEDASFTGAAYEGAEYTTRAWEPKTPLKVKPPKTVEVSPDSETVEVSPDSETVEVS